MLNKPLHEYDHDEIRNYLTGRVLIRIGAGDNLRSIMTEVIHIVTMWHDDRCQMAKEKKEKKEKKVS